MSTYINVCFDSCMDPTPSPYAIDIHVIPCIFLWPQVLQALAVS